MHDDIWRMVVLISMNAGQWKYGSVRVVWYDQCAVLAVLGMLCRDWIGIDFIRHNQVC